MQLNQRLFGCVACLRDDFDQPDREAFFGSIHHRLDRQPGTLTGA